MTTGLFTFSSGRDIFVLRLLVSTAVSGSGIHFIGECSYLIRFVFQKIHSKISSRNDLNMHDASKPFMRPSNQKDYAIKDLSVLSKAQLLELRDRQQDILKNK